jgi:hypothetical protein
MDDGVTDTDSEVSGVDVGTSVMVVRIMTVDISDSASVVGVTVEGMSVKVMIGVKEEDSWGARSPWWCWNTGTGAAFATANRVKIEMIARCMLK